MLDARIAMCARKGFDAVELDDIDSFDPPSTTGFHLTPGDAQNFLAYATTASTEPGMTRAVEELAAALLVGAPLHRRRGGRGVLPVPTSASPPSSPAAAQYGIPCTGLGGAHPCGWDAFTSTGKWVGEAEYVEDVTSARPGKRCTAAPPYSAFCQSVYAPANGFAAVNFDVDLDGALFQPCPAGR